MILQLLAATERTGQLEVRGTDEEHRGFLGVSDGRLVSAQYDDEDGYLALGAVFAFDRGDFEFLPQDRVERADLSGDLETLLERARAEALRILTVRQVVPGDRVRFRLSERAAERGEVTLAPEQWRALLLVDGARDVAALAERLGMRRLDAQRLFAELVRAGFADTVEPPQGAVAGEPPRAYRRLPPMQPISPTLEGEQVVLRGRLPDFPLETIVQLLAETNKTGRLEVHAGRDSSTLAMSDGQLVSAVYGEEEGELALGAAFTAPEGEFDFVPMADAPAANLTGALDPLLDRAASVRDRIVAIRALIPNDRARFTLSERATRNPEIVLTPEQWRVLLGVNGERDVAGVADQLRMRRLPVMMTLADLVRGGYVDVLPAAEEAWPYVERRRAPPPDAAVVPPALVPPMVVPAIVVPAIVVPAMVEEVAAPEEAIAVPEEHEAAPETLAEAPKEPEPAQTAAEAIAETEAEPAPPPAAWEPMRGAGPPETPHEAPSPEAAAAEATAEAFAPPSWEAPALSEPEPTEVDPRLAMLGAPAQQPEAPSWGAPATEAPLWEPPAPEAPAWEEPPPAIPAWEETAPEAPPAGPEPGFAPEDAAGPEPVAEIRFPPPPLPPAPAPPPEKKKKGLFGGLFGGGRADPGPAAFAAPSAGTRPGRLASFANELVAAYNSGQYGKARVDDRMLNLIMRADEQADPIDRPLPVTNDRLDVASIDRDELPEHQALPYLAMIVRQIYDDAERALGKDKARRGFRDVRDRLFGKDLALLHAPEVGARLPKV